MANLADGFETPEILITRLDTSIGISLNSRRMKAVPEALTLLSLISLLPDGVDNSELAAIFPSIDKSRRALSILWRTSLAYNDGHKPHARACTHSRAHDTLPPVGQRAPCVCADILYGVGGAFFRLGARTLCFPPIPIIILSVEVPTDKSSSTFDARDRKFALGRQPCPRFNGGGYSTTAFTRSHYHGDQSV
ncbi:hypothetical protein B0H14DRAFT_155781 [Mycena olivaceomarginata]|nr:hypothetical protein B0H14DRAFT_155781 [Mycena olivaceomarginata]